MNTASNLLAADGLKYEEKLTLDLSAADKALCHLEAYNNCFVLSGICKNDNGKKIKKCYFIKDREAKPLWIKGTPKNIQYRQLSYDNAQQTLNDYFANANRQSGDESLRVSIWLENAKWGELSLFCIDFDEYNEQSGFFKAAHALADKVTRSQGGGYHMWYGIDRQMAKPLFDSINLTTREGTKSFVCNIANVADGNKVDLFCENGRLIHEYEQWDNNTGVTDKTAALFELLSTTFTFREKRSVDDWQDATGKHIQIEGFSESVLLEEMTDKQQLVFEDLKTKSPDCTQSKWYAIGIDIKHIFGDELGGSVFLWWSKAGQSYQSESLANTWDDICNRENELRDSKWLETVEVNAFDVAMPAKEERKKQAEPIAIKLQSNLDELQKAENEYKALAAKGQFLFDDLLIQRQKNSISFTLPNENNVKITAYDIIKRLANKDFKAFKEYRKQEKINNNKIHLLPYSERYRLVFYFRQQYKMPPLLTNSDVIAAFINTANKYTNNWELKQHWLACLEATNTQEEAASLFSYYGWAADYDKEYPRTENAFYTVAIANGARCYNIVYDDITLRFTAIEHKGRTFEAHEVIADKTLQYDDKHNKLQSLLKPLLWLNNGGRMGLTTNARLHCEARINQYIDNLLSHNAFDGITLEEHIYRVEVDKSHTGIIFAQPQQFVITLNDMEFIDRQYNITAEYNRKNNADKGKKKAYEKYSRLVGDEWSSQELKAQGYTPQQIINYCKYNWIEEVHEKKIGNLKHYKRILR